MGFIAEVNKHLSTETRRESFKLHAHYPWTVNNGHGESEHIEIPYTDLPALVKALIRIMHDECDTDKVS